ncbi:3-hydroxyisobutyryl-CoA hydrolase 1-like isoform X5 [Brassica napus]|uniref:3-hydroxyisobutyryl-CoA hydrolase 1-like isoform X5 n=1 Tax=Brassica napus TaxID=3708 RepID=UPI00207895F9|nr:3-hydroxyisobutyryl-CoA hydrolase 1-like isoform X5 [Brassica napus]
MGSEPHSQVLVEETSSVRILTLNRPKHLNALSFNMITRLLQLFLAYEEDPSVKLVILKGQGRAFCAGGDVPAIVRDIRLGKWRRSADFMSLGYNLHYVMATYCKAQVSILNGIVMGGGVGVCVHGRFRIATENTVFAMPETSLGIFPDVGASYFLSRLPGFFGEYVGLTGARLDGAEMLACGLATHFVPSTRLTALEADLCRVGSSDPVTYASTILDAYTQHPHPKQKSACHRLDVIDKCFSRRTVEEIISALIREGRLQGLGQCLIRENRMVAHMMKGDISKDFVEWDPRRLEDMKDNMVDKYFKRVEEEEGWEDLKLPPRKHLPASAIAKL